MKFRGSEVDSKKAAILFIMHFMIFADIIFITVGMLLDLPGYVDNFILLFDLLVCLMLLSEWVVKFMRAKSKREFLKDKENIVTFIASIPYEVLVPAAIPGANLVRYIMLFKLLRIMVLYSKFFNGFKKFIRKTNLDIILGGIFFTVIIFTVLYLVYGSRSNLFENFYFVIVTLTTVGYGDIVPQTFNERVITLLLIVVGLFIVSTVTAALSSYLTDRLMSNDEEIVMDDIKDLLEENSDIIMAELKEIRQENKRLKDEISELKKQINDK